MKSDYTGEERREFERVKFDVPLQYKVCRKETISKLLEGYTSNISQAGLLCILKGKVRVNNILWLSFDRGLLKFCSDLEKRCFIYQQGIVGKVVRVIPTGDGNFEVGIKFITREEKDSNGHYLW